MLRYTSGEWHLQWWTAVVEPTAAEQAGVAHTATLRYDHQLACCHRIRTLLFQRTDNECIHVC